MERGGDPMTQFSFTDDYDEHGQPRQQTTVAVPRRSAGAAARTKPACSPPTPAPSTRGRTVGACPSTASPTNALSNCASRVYVGVFAE